MEFLLKFLFFITLVWVGDCEMSAEDVLDVVSTRVDHISVTLARVARRQKLIERRLDGIANNMKNSDRSGDSGNDLDVPDADMVEDFKAMKKAIASEKKYIRAQVDNMEEMITVLNDKLTSKTVSARKNFESLENTAPDGFESRIWAMEKLIRKLGNTSSNHDTKVLSMEKDIAALEKKSDGLENRVEYMTTNLSALVLASERKVSFYAQFRPPGNAALMLKNRRILFNHVDFNDGLGYNATSGIFTAPESGVYQFIFFVEGWQGVGEISCEAAVALLAVDQTAVAAAIAEPRHLQQTILAGSTYINYLTKGQKAWVQTGQNCDQYSIFGIRTHFSGVLLY